MQNNNTYETNRWIERRKVFENMTLVEFFPIL